MSDAAIPTERELQTLPRSASVFFAARCARRVLPLLEGRFPSPRVVVRLAGLAVDVSETFATTLGARPADMDPDIRNATLLYLAALTAAEGSGLAAALGSVAKSPAHRRIEVECRNAARAANQAGRLLRQVTSDSEDASLVPKLFEETRDAVTAALHIAGMPYVDDTPKGGIRGVGEVGIRPPESATNNDAVLTLTAIGGAISDASTIGATLWPGEAIKSNALALVGTEAVTRALPATSALSVARGAAETAAKANETADPVPLAAACYFCVSTAAALAPEIIPAIRKDFELLRATATRMGWTNDTPVTGEVCGPLWENGPPPDWPDSTFRADPVLATLWHREPAGVAEVPRHKVFISYSHKDKKFLDELLAHLRPLIRNQAVCSWSDKDIEPGSRWLGEIQNSLASAKVALLLVTKDFLASEFIHQHELGPLLKDAEKGGVHILWVPVRDCLYQKTALKDLQAVVSPDKPLAKMGAARDKAWVAVCLSIEKAMQNRESR